MKSNNCNRLRLSATEFVNDINILTYSESTERNCEMLKKAWDKVVKWTKRHGFKFNERKHKLIHFSRISKRYNMNANIALREHRVSVSINLRVLRIQLNFKLRWESHFCQMKTKLMSKHNAVSMIENSIWGILLATNRQKYIVIEKLMLAYGAAGRAFRRLIDVYKIIATKALKVEIYVLSINIHLKRLLQSSIVNMNARCSVSAVETAIQRIKKNLMLKRKRKSKLQMILLQAKRQWMQKHLKKTKTIFSQFYIAAPWVILSKMIIEIDKTRTSQTYDKNASNFQ